MTPLLRPVTKMKCSIPASRASSTTYWISGRSTIVSISFGIALVVGRKRVPRPATGNNALRNFFMSFVRSSVSAGRGQVERIVLALFRLGEAVVLARRPRIGRQRQQLLGGRGGGGHGRLGRRLVGRFRREILAAAAGREQQK